MSYSILSWLRELVWESRDLSSRHPEHLLTARILIGPTTPATTGSETDLVLAAQDEAKARALLEHLSRLGTVDRVLLTASDAFTPAMRRQLGRWARQQRKHGLLVEIEQSTAQGMPETSR